MNNQVQCIDNTDRQQAKELYRSNLHIIHRTFILPYQGLFLHGGQKTKRNIMLTTTYVLPTVVFVIAVTLLVKFAQLMRTRWKFKSALKDFINHPREIFFLGHAKAVSLF